MTLAKLEAHDLRNIESATLDPAPHLNFIIGPNACGKTSLLEAIYLLGRGRSFRTAQAGQLIRFGQPALTVTGRVSFAAGSIPLGLRIARGTREIHVQGRPAQSSVELIRAFPVVVIQPAAIELLEGAPRLRRQFLDFGAFHAEEGYLDCWRRYAKALGQRNRLLREKRVRELAPWNHELARYGTIVASARRRYAECLEPLFRDTAERFFGGMDFELRVQPGWNTETPLEAVLEQETESDLRHGYTQSGPHKGDFTIKLAGRSVKAYLSRGQMKLLVYALLLAQSRTLEAREGSAGCVLIDDVASELDDNNKMRLLEYLRLRPAQYFITATELRPVEEAIDGGSALFRVDAGRVSSHKSYLASV